MNTRLILFCFIVTATSFTDDATNRLRQLNLWLEDQIDASRGKTFPRLLWSHGDIEGSSYSVYPFRPLFADHFEDPKRPVHWFHRSENDSTETSVWGIYSRLHSDDASVRHKTEAWLCYGYVLYLWGSKAGREGENLSKAFPVGKVRKRMEVLTKLTDAHLHEKLSATKDIVKRVALVEGWLEPPSGQPIEEARSYFDQNASGHYGFIPVEFIYPLSWHIPRHQGSVRWVVKHYEEDKDYECKMLLNGMMPDEGPTVTKAWMLEAYLHLLAGKLLIDNKLPPWLSPEAQLSIKKECELWISEMTTFCERVPE